VCELRVSLLSKFLPHISQRYCLGLPLSDAAEEEPAIGIANTIP
jgi:hypothetical protein